MAYTMRHQRADGSVSVTKTDLAALEKFPCNPMSGRTAEEARQNIAETLRHTRRNLLDPKGYDAKRTSRLVAQIPAEVVAHVHRHEGAEAARDAKYLIRCADKLGIDCRVSRGRF